MENKISTKTSIFRAVSRAKEAWRGGRKMGRTLQHSFIASIRRRASAANWKPARRVTLFALSVSAPGNVAASIWMGAWLQATSKRRADGHKEELARALALCYRQTGRTGEDAGQPLQRRRGQQQKTANRHSRSRQRPLWEQQNAARAGDNVWQTQHTRRRFAPSSAAAAAARRLTLRRCA